MCELIPIPNEFDDANDFGLILFMIDGKLIEMVLYDMWKIKKI